MTYNALSVVFEDVTNWEGTENSHYIYDGQMRQTV